MRGFHAGVYQVSDLKAGSQGKAKKDLVMADLDTGAAAEAAGRDLVAVVDGNQVTLLGPTNNVGQAFEAVARERVIKGI
jgi:hypothetical protein